MPDGFTICIVDGRTYNLQYMRTSSDNGDLFSGTLHCSPPTNFRFLIRNNDQVEITDMSVPTNLPPKTVSAILKAIRSYENFSSFN